MSAVFKKSAGSMKSVVGLDLVLGNPKKSSRNGNDAGLLDTKAITSVAAVTCVNRGSGAGNVPIHTPIKNG